MKQQHNEELNRYATALRVAASEILPPYWIGGTDRKGYYIHDQGYSYCQGCAEKEVTRSRALHPEHDIYVAGGYSQEDDRLEWCQACGKPLATDLTEEGIKENFEHYHERGFLQDKPHECAAMLQLISAVQYVYPEHEAELLAILRQHVSLEPSANALTGA